MKPIHSLGLVLRCSSFRALLCFLLASLFCFSSSAEILVKSGDKIAFLGDSITQQGWEKPDGYVRLVISGLAANGIAVTGIPAGVSGNRSNDMLARVDAVLVNKPQWMTISCGVNDVWHSTRGDGIPLNKKEAAKKDPMISGKPGVGTYEENMTEIIDRAQKAGAKPVILTATMIQEDLKNPLNKRLESYNDFLHKLARERNFPLADLNEKCQKRIKAENKKGQNVLTVDGVHMNAEGNKIMALGILEAFGLGPDELKKAEDSWTKAPATPAPNP